MRVIILHGDRLFVPRFDLVPVLFAVRSGDVVRARPAATTMSPAPEPHAAAASLLGLSCHAAVRLFDAR